MTSDAVVKIKPNPGYFKKFISDFFTKEYYTEYNREFFSFNKEKYDELRTCLHGFHLKPEVDNFAYLINLIKQRFTHVHLLEQITFKSTMNVEGYPELSALKERLKHIKEGKYRLKKVTLHIENIEEEQNKNLPIKSELLLSSFPEYMDALVNCNEGYFNMKIPPAYYLKGNHRGVYQTTEKRKIARAILSYFEKYVSFNADQKMKQTLIGHIFQFADLIEDESTYYSEIEGHTYYKDYPDFLYRRIKTLLKDKEEVFLAKNRSY